jgi:hypothetical protein
MMAELAIFQIPAPKKAPGPDDGNEYNKRFTNPLWNQILLISWDYSGGCFSADSAVGPFRDRENIVRSPSKFRLQSYILNPLPSLNLLMSKFSDPFKLTG